MPRRPESASRNFCQNVGSQTTAVIEYDGDAFGRAANNGQMIEELNHSARAADHFRRLAMLLTHRSPTGKRPKKESVLHASSMKLGIAR